MGNISYQKAGFYMSMIGGIGTAWTLYERFGMGRPETVFPLKFYQLSVGGISTEGGIITLPLGYVMVIFLAIGIIFWKVSKND